MKFFITENEREGTCYFEFYKGKWDKKSFWKEDSICLHNDIWDKYIGFEKAVLKVIPSFRPLDNTEIFPEQWKKIEKALADESIDVKEIYKEADEWAKKTFEEYDRFTIIGM